MLRDIRQASWAWQDKAAMRHLRRYYDGDRLKQRATAMAIYQALTELASDQHRSDRAEAFVADLVEMTGTSEATVKRYLRDFEDIGLVGVQRRKLDERINLASVYSLLTVKAPDPPGSMGEPRGVTASAPPGSMGEPRGVTGEPQVEEEYVESNVKKEHQQDPEFLLFVSEIAQALQNEGVAPKAAKELAMADPDLAADWLDSEIWRSARDSAALLVAKLRAKEEPPRRPRFGRLPRR